MFITSTTTTTVTNMEFIQPPPPLISIPQVYNYNDVVSHNSSSSSSSPTSSLIIVVIIISSAIIVTATIYLLIRFMSRRCNITTADDVVSNNRNQNEHVLHHVISLPRNDVEPVSLPLFTFSSLTGKINGGDCAVCLSKFEGEDQLRLLPLCCHAFHAQCIDAWLKSNQTCPLCRSSVNPSEDDVMNKIAAVNNSFRIHIGSVSRRRDPSESDRRSYSMGSYEYVLDEDGYEISVESTHRRGASDCTSVDKDSTVTEPPRGENEIAENSSGRRNWLRDYVDRVSVSLSSRTQSFRGSGRFFTGSSRRNETVEDFEAGRIGDEISELFRWFSGV